VTIKPIAYIHTEFSEKFGVPRQSGLAGSLRGTIVFEPEYRNPDALRGLEEFSVCGSSGNSLLTDHRDGSLQCGLLVWAEMKEWGYSQPALRSDLMLWGCPVWKLTI